MSVAVIFVVLFTVAAAVALIARWLKIPYTVALVVAGLALGGVHLFAPPNLTKNLLYATILPGLLFEAAFHLEAVRFWQNTIILFGLARPGAVATMALTAVLLVPTANALHAVESFDYAHGLVFGALIAATDPIAVVATCRSLGAPGRLGVLVEGESLLNDGTAVVRFGLMFEIVSGGHQTAGLVLNHFVRVVGLGLVVGLGVGFAAAKVTQQVDEPLIEITLTTISAYGSFVVAELLGASGVLATVAAGMLAGNYAARIGMSPTTRVAVESFWEYVAFALNSVVFLLIGFEVSLRALVAWWRLILVAYFAVMLARAAIIFAASAALRAASAALGALDQMAREHIASPDVLAAIRDEYERRRTRVREEVARLHQEHRALEAEEARSVRRQLLVVEKDQLIELYRRGVIGRAVFAHLIADVDARRTALDEEESDAGTPTPEPPAGEGEPSEA